jgi:hypothetical protein
MQFEGFLSLPSWTVSYLGVLYDDARQDPKGIWHCRDIGTPVIHRFPLQERVVPMCKNYIDSSATI